MTIEEAVASILKKPLEEIIQKEVDQKTGTPLSECIEQRLANLDEVCRGCQNCDNCNENETYCVNAIQAALENRTFFDVPFPNYI